MDKKPGITKAMSPEAFAEELRKHGMDLPVQESMAELGKPLETGGKTAANRICIPTPLYTGRMY